MKDPQAVANTIEETFKRIHREQMQDIPILNPAIQVQAEGFHENDGRVLGIIITPWLMNLVMLPRDDEDWRGMDLGDKHPHQFPSKCYKFMVNEIDGIGICQTHSLYSPMNVFAFHDQAVHVARAFIDGLMVERELKEEDLVDEELLGKVMRGEETPEVELDEFGDLQVVETGAGPVRGSAETKVRVKKTLTRRDLLRGNFLQEN